MEKDFSLLLIGTVESTNLEFINNNLSFSNPSMPFSFGSFKVLLALSDNPIEINSYYVVHNKAILADNKYACEVANNMNYPKVEASSSVKITPNHLFDDSFLKFYAKEYSKGVPLVDVKLEMEYITLGKDFIGNGIQALKTVNGFVIVRAFLKSITTYQVTTGSEADKGLNPSDMSDKELINLITHKSKHKEEQEVEQLFSKKEMQDCFTAGVKFGRDMFNNPSNSEYINSLIKPKP